MVCGRAMKIIKQQTFMKSEKRGERLLADVTGQISMSWNLTSVTQCPIINK